MSRPDINPRARDLTWTLKALEQDLVDENGPRISTMRNYRFAIAVYDPAEEFDLRKGLSALSGRLTREGWVVHTISLHRVLLERLRRDLGEKNIERIIAREKRLAARPGGVERAASYLNEKITLLVEGPDGIAADVAAEIDTLIEENAERADRIVVFIARTGALYPFMRTSALLKHIDGRTHNLPVVLFYPGSRDGERGLSFMKVLPAFGDYRPQIYTPDSLKI